MIALLQTFRDDDGGSTAIEYGLIIGLISISITVSMSSFAGSLSGFFNAVAGAVNAASP
jgi:pilus assembly protein Flp/PilA